MNIPAQGKEKEALFELMEGYRANDVTWRDGRTWAYVYDPGREAEAVIKKAFTSFLSENALDPTVFPSLLRFENELVSMCANHLGGGDEVVGNFTSGGTESIILALKTARDHARATKPEIKEPEMVLPVTAHAAFHKAAHYLGVKPVVTPVDPTTFKADVDAMRDAITPNTILLVGSAVSYAHGVIDPITEIGALAQKHGLLCHVDGCIGGFLLQYFRRLGAEIAPFDFQVPGVTSISMDLHKYAFAAKGASVILYNNKELRRHQFYACAAWSGYTVVNATVQSTKSGGPLAAAWAALHYIGDEGYMGFAKVMLEATRKIIEGIDAIDDLYVLGKPEMNLVAFSSDTVSVFHLADELTERGWYVQPQLGYQESKENIHLSINPKSVKWVDELLKDIRECCAIIKGREGELGEMGAMLSTLSADQLDPEMFQQMLGMAGIQGNQLPDRMAGINELLNVLPADVNEQLIIEFMNDLYIAETN